MSRINIDIKISSDYRFQRFMLLVGDRVKAKGFMWELWELALVHWYPNKQLIPYSDWESSGLPHWLVECGLAEKRESGYYARGSEDYFAWKFDCRDAGRKSAESRKKKYGTAQPIASETPNDVRTAPNAIELNLTLNPNLNKKNNTSTFASRNVGDTVTPSASGEELLTSPPKKQKKTKLEATPEVLAEIEAIYELYPYRKKGQDKRKGIQRLLAQLEVGSLNLGTFRAATINYSNSIDVENDPDGDFVKMFATFTNPDIWTEWINVEKPKHVKVDENEYTDEMAQIQREWDEEDRLAKDSVNRVVN